MVGIRDGFAMHDAINNNISAVNDVIINLPNKKRSFTI